MGDGDFLLSYSARRERTSTLESLTFNPAIIPDAPDEPKHRPARKLTALLVGLAAVVCSLALPAPARAYIAPTATFAANIPVGKNPTDLKTNPAGTRAYVANEGSASLSVIDTTTRRVIKTLPVAPHPVAVAVNRAGTRVYVKSGNTVSLGTVAIIDTTSNVTIGSINLGPDAGDIEISKDGTRLYVGRSFGLSVLDAVTGKSVAELTLPANPGSFLLNQTGTRLYSTSENGSTGDILVIDTAKNILAARIHTPFVPGGIALDPAGARLYVGIRGSKSFAVVSTTTNTITRNVPYLSVTPPGAELTLDPAGQHLYTKVSGFAFAQRTTFTEVDVTDPATGKTSVLGRYYTGAAGELVIAPGASAIYAPMYDKNTVMVIAVHQLKGLATAPLPTITGIPARGQRLTGHAGIWQPAGVSLRYQWLRSGLVIPGATGSTYVLTTADVGKTINLRILGSKAGYVSLYRYSTHTRTVTAR